MIFLFSSFSSFFSPELQILRLLTLDQAKPAQAPLLLSPFPFYMKSIVLPDVLAARSDGRPAGLQVVRTGSIVPVADYKGSVSVHHPLQKMPIMSCASGSDENTVWIPRQNKEILFIDFLNFFYLNHI